MFDADELNRLARFFASEANPDESRNLRAWIDADPTRAAAVRELQHAWQLAAPVVDQDAVTRAWQQLERRRLSRQTERDVGGGHTLPLPRVSTPRSFERVGQQRSRRSLLARGLAAAAAVTVITVGGAVWLRGERATVQGGAGSATAAREYRTARGQRATVTLRDGSVVELGAESRLLVRLGDTGARDLELTGEAIFHVTHDAKRPFVVRARGVWTEDLGTRFAVRAYDDATPVRVLVTEGQVTVRTRAERTAPNTVLNPGDRATLAAAGMVLVDHSSNIDDELAWTRGRFTYRSAPVGEIADAMQRWFDVTVRFEPATLRTEKVTVDMPLTSLGAVLNAITMPLALTHQRNGDTIIVRQTSRGGSR